MARTNVHRLSTYWCLYSSNRSPQYAVAACALAAGLSTVKSKDAQPTCVTTSGTMPMLARLATVLFTLPSMAELASLTSVVASVVSTDAH